jgi:hypothetical protein
MDLRKTALERAFELARSGKCLSFNDIVQHVKTEGYSLDQLAGPTLKKQLLELVVKAKKTDA